MAAKIKTYRVYVGAFLSDELAARLRQLARQRDRSTSSLIRLAVHAYLTAEELR